MRILDLPAGATPRQWGRLHGESFRNEIKEIGAIRLDLCARVGGFAGEGEVLALARAHMPTLEAFDADLHAELVGIAEGAGVDEGLIVVVNHYTDLRDLGPAFTGSRGGDVGGCTAALARTPQGAFLGQTWDMHGSATPFVIGLNVPASQGAPAALMLSITGCVGMAGLNGAGVGVTINNLRSFDAAIGVVWPALVRRLLRERSARVAFDLLMDSPIASGHHYLIADPDEGFGVETSGQLRRVVFDDPNGTFVHTNHCLDPEVEACSAVAPGSTTFERYDLMTASIRERPVEGFEDLWARFASHEGYPRSVCTHMSSPEKPHATDTCGAAVFDLAGRRIRAAAGCIVQNPSALFQLTPDGDAFEVRS